jgi:hypothetical protein
MTFSTSQIALYALCSALLLTRTHRALVKVVSYISNRVPSIGNRVPSGSLPLSSSGRSMCLIYISNLKKMYALLYGKITYCTLSESRRLLYVAL